MNQSKQAQQVSSFSSLFAMFPGQGSQYVGMSKDLYEQFSVAREVFEEASDAIHLNLKKLCFEGPESDLTLTENTQPCLLTSSIAAFRVAERELNFIPGAVAGHSLGEYTALVAAGCLDLTTAVSWVRQRGLAMQAAVPAGQGAMAAILGLEDQAVELLCQTAVAVTHKRHQERRQEHLKDPHTNDSTVETTVEPANYNAPGQVVIAGSTDGIAEAVGLLKTDPRFSGGKAIPLAVSAPFHCRLMAPAREKMADLFSHTSSQKVHPLKMPYIPNRTGRLSQEAGTVIQLLTEQIDHPVLWKQSIVTVLEAQFSVAIEFGPGKVLSGLTKRIANHTSKSCNLLALNDTASFKNLESVLKGLS